MNWTIKIINYNYKKGKEIPRKSNLTKLIKKEENKMTKKTNAKIRLPKPNFEEKTIVITKTFAKKAGIIGTDEFRILQQYREIYKDFEVQIAYAAPKRNKKDSLRGLNYSFMERYIEKHDDEDHSNMTEFKSMTVKNDENVKPKSYGAVKKWFLKMYPEIQEAA